MDDQSLPEPQPTPPGKQDWHDEPEKLDDLPAQSREDQLVWGCLSAFLVTTILACVAGAGFVWTSSLLPQLSGPGDFAGYALRAGLYSALLIIPFGLVALFLKQERFALWRGLALALAVAGGHALILGLLLAVDHTSRYPTLPHWLPPVVSIVFSAAVIALGRRRFLARPNARLLLLAAGLGLLVSIAWLWVGTLGNIVEIWLALLDTLATALVAAVLLRLITFYDDDFPARHPLWSSLLTGVAFAAILYGLMAVRGYALQGTTLSTALLLAGVVAGALMTLGEKPEPSRLWWAAFVFLFFVLLIPYNWTEGFEGDYMFEDLSPAWAPAALASILIAFVEGVVLLVALVAARKWLAKNAERPAVAFSVVGWSVLVCAVVYVSMGRPGVQAETFFVVLKDQADTSSAMDIKNLAQRREKVYSTLTEQADQSQGALRAFLDAQHVTYRPYYLVNAIEVDGNPILRAQIAVRPEVARILDSPHARSLPVFTKGFGIPSFQLTPDEPGWNIQQMNVQQVWENYQISGKGIVVGSADTGVDWSHPAIRGQYLGSASDHNYTWYDPWYGHTTPDDAMGHGTHTTGTMVGQGGIGVAPSARWIACRNLARNLGNPAVYLDCMQFLFAPFPMAGNAFKDGDTTRGADVVNNSWGCPEPEGCDAITLSIAVEHLYHAGQMYVVSAGNDGPDCSTVSAPANAEHALSVGAIQEGGGITGFSSRGPITADGSGRIKPDVAAPGSNILSSVPGGGYTPLDGTSMAGPHVAGLVALLWSANPALKGDIDRTVQIIEQTARYQTAPDLCGAATGKENNVYGYGDVDALAAVKMALGK